MRIAIFGIRGPGFYGGFETFAAEVAPRLAARGHDVRVYARSSSPSARWRHPGVRVVTLPSIPTKNLDTITHSFLCALHLLVRRPDVAIVLGVGNSPWSWLLRRLGVATVINVDGLDRTRAKWGRFAKAFLHWTERLSPRAADVVVTDAESILDYYRTRYERDTTFIAYGAPDGPVPTRAALDAHGLEADGYVLYVTRLEPENNAHLLVQAYRKAQLEIPLVVVGDVPYDSPYAQSLKAEADEQVRFPGFVFGDGYRELQSHAAIYAQCTEVGGTHPALVEAMGFGNAVVALETPEHREVLGDAGRYFTDAAELADLLRELAADAGLRAQLRAAARARAAQRYSWDAVTAAYERSAHEALAARSR